MALDKVEAIVLARVFLQELEKAMTDANTPGKVTVTEWGAIASTVGTRAFKEVLD